MSDDPQDQTASPDTPTSGMLSAPAGPTPDDLVQAPSSDAAGLPAQSAPPSATPQTVQDGPPQAPAKPSLWQNVVTGALNGLKGAAEGLAMKGIPGALAGAVSPDNAQTAWDQRKALNQAKVDQAQSNIRFSDAQAAHLAILAHQQELLNAALPDDIRDKQINQGLATIDNLNAHGWAEHQIMNNTAQDADSALQAQTADRGSVGPQIAVNLGDKIHLFHLDDVSDPVALQLINKDRDITGLPPVEKLSDLGSAQDINNAKLAAGNRFGQTPTAANAANNVAQWQTRYNTYAAKADPNPDVLGRIKTELNNQKSILDFYNGNTADEAGRVAQAKADVEKQATAADKRAATGPVFAVDPSGQTVLTTKDQAAGMTAVRPVKQSDIQAATHDNNVLEAVTRQMNSVTDSASALDQGQYQSSLISAALDSDKFKLGAHGFGAGVEIPTGSVSDFFRNQNQKDASPQTLAYVTAVLNLREAAMGMNKLVTGSARASESQIQALQNTLPGYENNSGIVHQKLAKFAQDVDSFRTSVPVIPGNPRTAVKKPQPSGTGGSY